MEPNCTIHYLDPTDLPRGVADPGLNALVRGGWTVLTTVVLVEGSDEAGIQRIAVILAPPKPAPVPPPHTWTATAPGWRVVAGGLVVLGTGVAACVVGLLSGVGAATVAAVAAWWVTLPG